MTSRFLRRVLFAGAIAVSSAVLPTPARADQCGLSCAFGHHVCAMQAWTEAKACVLGCGSGAAALPCAVGCLRTFRAARAACRATRVDCSTSCPTASEAVDTCSPTCSANTPMCFANASSVGKACVQRCSAGAASVDCFKQCAVGLRSSGATCQATLQGCLAGCQGPVNGACFDTIALQCTTEACSSAQACSRPNEFCSPRCGSPAPSGTCFDPTAMQCTTQACSPSQPCAATNQTCVPICPPPAPIGTCFDTITKECTDQSCAMGTGCRTPNQLCTLQCPPPPQCSSVPCGGPCVVPFPCPAGKVCNGPDVPAGECEMGRSGTCECVPMLPSPAPTPTPQCSSVPCAGTCEVASPCPLGATCPVFMGQCEMSTSGACECVPILPTPGPTPTPQCAGATCGGPCTVPLPCVAGSPCPDLIVPGQCEASTAGGCTCVPIKPTPMATPTPACTGSSCGGPCVIEPPCFPFGCELPAQLGTCETVSGTCTCVPVTPIAG